MSVRVNLLPGEVATKQASSRARYLAAGAGAALVAVLAVVYVWQLGRVSTAEDELAAAEAIRDGLQGEVNDLQEFGDLQGRVLESEALLALSLGGEVSFAGILQDVASVMPSDSALTQLSLTLAPAAEAEFDFGDVSIGRLTGSGETLRNHSPGVERLLLAFDKVSSFFNVYLTSSTAEQDSPVTTYNFELDLNSDVLTLRYLAGLPEVLQ